MPCASVVPLLFIQNFIVLNTGDIGIKEKRQRRRKSSHLYILKFQKSTAEISSNNSRSVSPTPRTRSINKYFRQYLWNRHSRTSSNGVRELSRVWMCVGNTYIYPYARERVSMYLCMFIFLFLFALHRFFLALVLVWCPFRFSFLNVGKIDRLDAYPSRSLLTLLLQRRRYFITWRQEQRLLRYTQWVDVIVKSGPYQRETVTRLRRDLETVDLMKYFINIRQNVPLYFARFS